MAEKLGLGTGIHDLKIGDSFFQSGSSGSAGRGKRPPTYHSIRYDFKPASSSTADSGFLQVDDSNNGVSVAVPNSGGGQTNYSGHQKKANQKECILIIDKVTGEITLERLSSQIMVKKTRPERPERPERSQNVPQTASSKPQASAAQPVEKAVQRPQHQARLNPPAATGDDRQRKKSPSPAPAAAAVASQPPATKASAKPTKSNTNCLSSGSSSATSSDSSSSDSDSDGEAAAPARQTAQSQPTPANSFSMPDFLSGGLGGHSSNIRGGDPPAAFNKEPSASKSAAAAAAASSNVQPPPNRRSQPVSMPLFLNDDLELSESDSD